MIELSRAQFNDHLNLALLNASSRRCADISGLLAHDAAQRDQREQDRQRIEQLERDQNAAVAVAKTFEQLNEEKVLQQRIAALEQEVKQYEEEDGPRWKELCLLTAKREKTLTLALAQARAVIEAAKAVDATWNFQPGDEQSPPVYMDLIDTEALMALRKALAVPAAGGGDGLEETAEAGQAVMAELSAAAPAPTPGPGDVTMGAIAPLVWTTEKPKELAWYWFRFTDKNWKGSDDPEDWCIVQVWQVDGKLVCTINETGSIDDLGHGFTQWAGPLPEPKGA